MIALSRFLIVCAILGSTISLPLAVDSRESMRAHSRAKNVRTILTDVVALSDDINSMSVLSHRSTESIETPDNMWKGIDRIRRSTESAEIPDTMWKGIDRIRRSEELIRSPEIMWDQPDDDSLRLSQ